MSNLVYCKACGYIFEEGKYEFCPACGVPAKMFEPYVDKIPADRRKILKLDIHPVVVHAPQAVAFILLLLSAALTIMSQFAIGTVLVADFSITIKVLSVLLPFTVFGAIVTGILDAKYRYKTHTTSHLMRKKFVGTLFLLLATGMAIISLQGDFINEFWMQGLYLLLNIGAFVCTAVLGIWGAALVHGIMGGPMPKKKKSTTAVPASPPSSDGE